MVDGAGPTIEGTTVRNAPDFFSSGGLKFHCGPVFNLPEGFTVTGPGVSGCEPSDSDGDGVPDAIDACPATPPGTAVNATGCSSACLTRFPGLVSWWPAEGTPLDAVGANHGVLFRGTGFGTGQVGQAFSFDGVDDLVHVPSSPGLNLQTALTLDAWINPSIAGGQDRIIAGRPSGYRLILLADDRLRFVFPLAVAGQVIDQSLESTTAVSHDTWAHVAATFDASTGEARLYVNGTLENTLVAPGSIAGMDRPFQIGGFDSSGVARALFAGLIDEVALFDRALAPEEILLEMSLAGRCGEVPRDAHDDAYQVPEDG